MKPRPEAVLAALLASWVIAGSAHHRECPAAQAPYVERARREFAFYPGGKIELVAALPGNVTIEGWERAAVAVESERIVYYLPDEQARALAAQYPLRIRHGQTSATIATQGPPASPIAMEANLKIRVPAARTDLQIRIFKGDLSVRGVNGWVEANLTQGNLAVSSVQGYFSAITREGDLDVELGGRRWSGQGFSAVTQRGSADLRLPPDYSAALQLETLDGNITVDYPEQTVEGERIPLHVLVKNKARRLTASVGEGGAPVKIQTQSGDIRLSATAKP